jgi:DNA-binding NtrC family response regulator
MSLNICYLDDEVELLEMFSDLFSDDETIIRTFSDPKTAIDQIKLNPPDLIFLDFRLPHTNGDEVALKLDSKIPKALITGEIDVDLEANFSKIFAKPYNVEEIKSFIKSQASNK